MFMVHVNERFPGDLFDLFGVAEWWPLPDSGWFVLFFIHILKLIAKGEYNKTGHNIISRKATGYKTPSL